MILDISSRILANHVDAFADKWELIPGFGDRYRASFSGLVESRVVRNGQRPSRTGDSWRPLSPVLDRTGVVRVSLWKDGKSHSFAVKEIVASLFLRPLRFNEKVIHLDNNSSNLHVFNLQIVSGKYSDRTYPQVVRRRRPR